MSDQPTPPPEAASVDSGERVRWIYECAVKRLAEIDSGESSTDSRISIAVGALLAIRDWAREALSVRAERPAAGPAETIRMLREALVAAEQFIHPEVHRGPDSFGWQTTVDMVNRALAAAPSVSAPAAKLNLPDEWLEKKAALEDGHDVSTGGPAAVAPGSQTPDSGK